MRSLGLLFVTVSLSSLASCWTGGHRDVSAEHRRLRARNIVYNGEIQSTYDFVIAGGGTAGLVIASRLSEDSNTTVLVLEAGDTGDAIKDSIDVPANAYYKSTWGTTYDWQFATVPQPKANNRVIAWARGKILGGCSATNGMYQVRPSELEVDTWESLIAPEDSVNSKAWSWANFLEAMKKSETFTPPSDAIKAEADIAFDPSSRGTNGPIHVSYPGYSFPVIGNWTPTLQGMGVPQSPDAYNGQGWGTFIVSSAINPTNWTRSFARSGYIDPLPPRSNLDILPNATVTRLVFSNSNGQITATGVEYAATSSGPRVIINVRKEVIITGGAVGSPHILLHSGVGPQDVLSAAGVPVVYNLPGVGQHLQDHISAEIIYNTTIDTAGSIHASNSSTANSAEFLSYVNDATSYVNISSLVTDVATFQSGLNTFDASLVPSTDPTVIAGYQAIYNASVNKLLNSPVGQVEILLALTGTASGAQTIGIQAALQRPLSQGRLYINTSDPFAKPVIDPNYLSHAADLTIMRQGLKMARAVGASAPLNIAIGAEVSPGVAVSNDTQWETWLTANFGTEFHPSCTCAMLPLNQGGVVNANLQVYGLTNVRVADASVFPIEFSAHLMAPVYGLAEQAATIIRANHNSVTLPWAAGAPSPSSTSSGSSNGSGGKKSGALPRSSISSSFALLGCSAIAVAAAIFTL
ncbi:hypothetical protein JAAARDRAFT_190666 [Jaapia argillacea MUCL 33604]|uniref:Glucose-methanol-choline oxidoreductase N-terminal domain-containing protein n=1 Tax=Jaapia argillacea MUCL 33604 TaxID=933084 RepID=A0A067Q744_9AGAM|nr:hypothetical protein JAAARDRAFT_190666 [Jaapia argillacea MUCL 33604]